MAGAASGRMSDRGDRAASKAPLGVARRRAGVELRGTIVVYPHCRRARRAAATPPLVWLHPDTSAGPGREASSGATLPGGKATAWSALGLHRTNEERRSANGGGRRKDEERRRREAQQGREQGQRRPKGDGVYEGTRLGVGAPKSCGRDLRMREGRL